MDLSERGKIGNAVMAQQAAERAEQLRRHLEEGEAFKRAAHRVGVSVRTARRYRGSWR